MIVLGIETSCDETSAAIVKNGTKVLSNIIASSKDMFTKSGGVIPEEAARQQVKCMIPVLNEAFSQADKSWPDIDLIAFAAEPGLTGSLLVGTTTARTLASVHKKPIVGIHHTMGHLSSVWLDNDNQKIEFPVLALSVSGGHSDLWYRTSHCKGELIGKTRDDAAGEAFDKGACLLGLAYPGGPAIAKKATEGDESKYDFPLPLKDDDTLDFSFSGLKTALKYIIRDLNGYKKEIPHLAASYQNAIGLHLLKQISRALKKYPKTRQLHLVGGVSANQHLRSLLEKKLDIPIRYPVKISYCTDNAAMIAAAGYFLTTKPN